jgi:hypothetical protein
MKIPFTDDDDFTHDQFLSGEPELVKGPEKGEKQKPFHRLSSAEHLKEASNALADGYKIDTDPMKTVWGRLNDAKRHLMAIGPRTTQYLAAKELAGEVSIRKKQIQDACTNIVHRHMVNQREILANELEHYFVNKGIYVEIELNGSGKTSLRVSSPVFQITSIKRIAYETAFFFHLKNVGFTNIAFENNDGEIRMYKLEPQ